MTVNHDVTGSSPVGGAKKEYSLSTVGVDDAGGPPVPIPNTEVKPCSAEDSCLVTGCENRKMPTSDSEYFFIQKRAVRKSRARLKNYNALYNQSFQLILERLVFLCL